MDQVKIAKGLPPCFEFEKQNLKIWKIARVEERLGLMGGFSVSD